MALARRSIREELIWG